MTQNRDKKDKICDNHILLKNSKEIKEIQSKLLSWYSDNKRILPWRTVVEEEKNVYIKAYSGKLLSQMDFNLN